MRDNYQPKSELSGYKPIITNSTAYNNEKTPYRMVGYNKPRHEK